MSSPCVCVQWSFGVTCWEIFSTAKTPYPGIHPTSLITQLENGERLPNPNNAACSDAMYVIILLNYGDNIQLALLSSSKHHAVSDQELDSRKGWEQGEG